MIPKIILKSGREKPVNQFHPWVYSGGIKHFPKAKNGSIVAVCNNQEQVLGYGFYSPNRQLACRIFQFGPELYDFESTAYWFPKFETAMELRKKTIDFAHTNAYRLVFSEADFIPGLIVDIYDRVAVVQILTKGTEQLLPAYLQCLQQLGWEYIYVRIKDFAAEKDEEKENTSYWVNDSLPQPIRVCENHITFLVNVEKGQKTGFFIDQRTNRALLASMSKNKKVLNTFCYTGGFSVYALVGGAAKVVSVDISKDALMQCTENINLHAFADSSHETVWADVFEYLKKNTEKYDIVILDPPAFSKSHKTIPNASRGYKELNMLGLRSVQDGGWLMTYSCSQNIDPALFQKIVFSAAADVRKRVQVIKYLHQSEDHPVNIFHPEGQYLKGLLLYVTDF